MDIVLDSLATSAERRGLPWWVTPTADLVITITNQTAFSVVLGGLIRLLREGADPAWVCGGGEPEAAFVVVEEWLRAGVDPGEVEAWFRSGCWDAKSARRLIGAGLRPHHLLGPDHRPLHWVQVSPPGTSSCD